MGSVRARSSNGSSWCRERNGDASHEETVRGCEPAAPSGRGAAYHAVGTG
jgi:hypothetical protein